MFSAYKKALMEHVNLPGLMQLSPWQAAFKDEIHQRSKAERAILNFSMRTRLAMRNHIARRTLRGRGLEIGAQCVPTLVDRSVASVEYIDRLTAEETAKQFGIPLKTLVHVSHLIDGTDLGQFQSGSYDFLIANHVLEHFDNPVGGIIEWFRVLKPGGRLFITLPNYRNNPFDFRRRPPTKAHFRKDFENEQYRLQNNRLHYADLVQSIHGFDDGDPLILATADLWINQGDRQHYHVYDEQAVRDVMALVSERSEVGLRIVDHFLLDSAFEFLIVIEKDESPQQLKWPDVMKSRTRALMTLAKLSCVDMLTFYAGPRKKDASTIAA